jgi:hypothetical protein
MEWAYTGGCLAGMKDGSESIQWWVMNVSGFLYFEILATALDVT